MIITTLLDALSHFFGHGLCHQLPERSFEFGGVLWPVCARCIGIYLGILCVLAALFLVYRGRQRSGGLPWPYWLALALALALMAYDGLSSYLYFRETTNALRLISGIAVGGMVAPLMYTLLVGTLARSSVDDRIFGDDGEEGGARPVLYLLGGMLSAAAFVYLLSPLLGPFSALVADLSIWATFALLILMLVGLARPFEGSVSTWRDLTLPLALSAVISLILIMALAILKILIIGG